MQELITPATIKNWERLHTDSSARLTKRANKKRSERIIIPREYIKNPENIPEFSAFSEMVTKKGYDIAAVIKTVVMRQLFDTGIAEKAHVKKAMAEYENLPIIAEIKDYPLPRGEQDTAGIIYQCLQKEGTKNIKGSYYTPQTVVRAMLKDVKLKSDEKFLDPCCGSGAFLTEVKCESPNRLFGVDNDAVAVMIARANLLIKYADVDFLPNIYCGDFLSEDFAKKHFEGDFKYIATNPPWGAKSGTKISYRESSVCFFEKAYDMLAEGGKMHFLMPEAILNVKKHEEFREFLLEEGRMESITRHTKPFSGVITGYVDIAYSKKPPTDEVVFYSGEKVIRTKRKILWNLPRHNIMPIGEKDEMILKKVEKKKKYTLKDSVFALGIVTGGNGKMLKDREKAGFEPIITGKEIKRFSIDKVKRFIKYEKGVFQQDAGEDKYRAEEKLIYKFISAEPIFAYDNQKRLILNSANMLIPKIDGMSVKTCMAFLNSELYAYLCKTLFGEVKILKGNLEKLPFPQLDEKTNERLEQLAERAMADDSTALSEIDDMIYNIFELEKEDRAEIKKRLLK